MTLRQNLIWPKDFWSFLGDPLAIRSRHLSLFHRKPVHFSGFLRCLSRWCCCRILTQQLLSFRIFYGQLWFLFFANSSQSVRTHMLALASHTLDIFPLFYFVFNSSSLDLLNVWILAIIFLISLDFEFPVFEVLAFDFINSAFSSLSFSLLSFSVRFFNSFLFFVIFLYLFSYFFFFYFSIFL